MPSFTSPPKIIARPAPYRCTVTSGTVPPVAHVVIARMAAPGMPLR